MSVTMGPVLALAGAAPATWTITATVIATGDDAPAAAYTATPFEAGGVPPDPAQPSRSAEVHFIEDRGARKIYRCRFDIERLSGREQAIDYRFGDRRDLRFIVPAADVGPRLAYASCNGYSDPAAMKGVKVKNALWRRPKDAPHLGLLDRHGREPVHLMLLGGDQIYADPIWTKVKTLEDWLDLDFEDQVKRIPPAEEDAALADFYLTLYEDRWSQKDVRDAFASIPSLMMWDDQDIFDGWGSYEDALLDSPTYRGIFKHAAHHFDLFQRQRPIGAGHDADVGETGRSVVHDLGGGIAVLALDMRTERRIDQVIGDQSWKDLVEALKTLAERASTGDDEAPDALRHLLVMSSIPVVHPDMSWLEGPVGFFGSELEDDLRDHWNSHAHKGERLRLVHRLFALNKQGIRVTFLSGDVHIAAAGAIE